MVFCFGELLLRMSPSLKKEWIHKATMPVYIGGSELNVTTALTKWNVPAKYCTALPENYLSKEIVEEIKDKNIDVSAIHFSGNRIGSYFLPQGADLKNAGVIYDRFFSSFYDLQPGMINWDEALKDCTWFHFSAISPALSENVAAVCKEALQAASAKKLTVSIDLNYRSKLWQYGKKPVEMMPDLVQYCHIIMGNLWSVESLLGIASPIKESVGKTHDELVQASGESMLQLHRHYPQATTFAYTFRLENNYWAVLQHGPERVISKQFAIGKVVDGVGSGDCFMAGLIYGIYSNHSPHDIINYSAAAAVGKLHEKGDATSNTIESVNTILKNGKA
jgi:2-dehydro-3-deoxygluconokinase